MCVLSGQLTEILMEKYEGKKVWFTSDLHFWHKNICKYCDRPYESVEEMNQGIIANWNSVVKEDDIVFVLGDLGFCGIEKLKVLIPQLKGTIVVIQGNHDSDKVIDTLYNEEKLGNNNMIHFSCKDLGDYISAIVSEFKLFNMKKMYFDINFSNIDNLKKINKKENTYEKEKSIN